MNYIELSNEFLNSVRGRGILKGIFGSSLFPMHHYAPYVPHFQSGGGMSVQPPATAPYTGAVMEQYMSPMCEIMARQQILIEQQQENQQKQQTTVFGEQNALIKEMFSSFESSFKNVLDTMSSMMTANNEMAMKSQSHPKRRSTDVPEVFSKAVPIAQARQSRQESLERQELAAANAPIHIHVDPETGKISRQDSDNAA